MQSHGKIEPDNGGACLSPRDLVTLAIEAVSMLP